MRLAAVLAGAIALSGAAARAADGTLVWSSMGSTVNPIVRCGPVEIAKKIMAITGHKEEVHLGASAFANPTKQYEQLARGIVDFSWGVLSYTPGRFALTEILTLPFVSADNKAASKAIMSLLARHPALAKETGDVHLLAIVAAGPYQLHLREPIDSVANLGGRRLRVVGAPLSKSVKALGGDVAALPMPQVYENMQKGVVDGLLGANASLIAFKLNEVSTFHVMTNISVPVIFAGLSKKYYNSLSAEQKARIDKELAGPEAAARYAACWDKVDKAGLGLAEKRGSKIRNMTPAEEAEVRTKLRPVIDEYLAELEKKGLPARVIYDDLTKEIAKAKRS
jgi:TRAP-type C4-dicarboxylate transport system substrate-binding protein